MLINILIASRRDVSTVAVEDLQLPLRVRPSSAAKRTHPGSVPDKHQAARNDYKSQSPLRNTKRRDTKYLVDVARHIWSRQETATIQRRRQAVRRLE